MAALTEGGDALLREVNEQLQEANAKLANLQPKYEALEENLRTTKQMLPWGTVCCASTFDRGSGEEGATTPSLMSKEATRAFGSALCAASIPAERAMRVGIAMLVATEIRVAILGGAGR